MRNSLQNQIYIFLGWFFVVLGTIGAVLPVLPTTPFLILALALFARSSPRFHGMLLNNRWFGPTLKQWEESKTLDRKIKLKALFLIFITFAISISIVESGFLFKLILASLGVGVSIYIWRIKEK